MSGIDTERQTGNEWHRRGRIKRDTTRVRKGEGGERREREGERERDIGAESPVQRDNNREKETERERVGERKLRSL